jgi:hypothetical protein
LDQRVQLEWLPSRAIADAQDGDFAVSCPGTLAAAEVRDPDSGETFILVSMYGLWERPHVSTARNWIYADASVHRLISDLSVFVGRQNGHRIIAAGDLNVLYGYGEHGGKYWGSRYQTIFDRMSALGLRFVGPQSPNGCQADPWPDELPRESRCVPTYRTNRHRVETAKRQVDFVFASDAIADRVEAWALNEPSAWGSSDHCRIRIEIR